MSKYRAAIKDAVVTMHQAEVEILRLRAALAASEQEVRRLRALAWRRRWRHTGRAAPAITSVSHGRSGRLEKSATTRSHAR